MFLRMDGVDSFTELWSFIAAQHPDKFSWLSWTISTLAAQNLAFWARPSCFHDPPLTWYLGKGNYHTTGPRRFRSLPRGIPHAGDGNAECGCTRLEHIMAEVLCLWQLCFLSTSTYDEDLPYRITSDYYVARVVGSEAWRWWSPRLKPVRCPRR
jgi:hypothetical protein